MIYRLVNAERMEQVKELWDYCFEKREEPFFQYYFNEYCGKNNMVIGAFEKVGEEEKLRSMVHVNPYLLRIRGQEQLAPYLVGVATAPEARGQHAFAPLLQTTFDVLRDQGVTFVTLMPIFAGIYLPYEFGYCYYRHEYKLSLQALGEQLGRAERRLQVERVALVQEVLAPIYEQVTAGWNGVPKRTDFQWQKLLAVHNLEHVQCAVVYDDRKPVGYMLYQISNDCFQILELMAGTYEVRMAFLRYAAMHQSSAKEVHWLAEPWDKTYLGFKDQSLTGSLQPFMMARCLDARAALGQLAVGADVPEGSVVLLLTDEVIARNNHLLKLAVASGQLHVASTMDDEEVTMNMAAFTQLYFGAFSATELAEAGRIKVKNPAKLAVLDSLFPKCRNYINEYF